jgi:hypothetical protein
MTRSFQVIGLRRLNDEQLRELVIHGVTRTSEANTTTERV